MEDRKTRKVGILTFHYAFNYGAVFQTYALMRAINNINTLKAEIIDYTPIKQIRHNKNIIKRVAKLILLRTQAHKRNRNFQSFRNNKFRLSKHVTKDTISLINDEYHAFVAGSDQIWNTDFVTKEDTMTYLLDFADHEKIKLSYAASIGNLHLKKDDEGCFRNLLSGFNAISVREQSAVRALAKVSDRDIQVHVDPVFLLPSEEWEDLIVPIEDLTSYILIFVLRPQNYRSLLYAARKSDPKRNAKIIVVSHDINIYRFYYISKNDVKYKFNIPPTELLYLLNNANMVFTDSFHGTAMSIIFHTKFFSEINISWNTRILNILNIVGLEDRVLRDGVAEIPHDAEIDWDSVERKLEIERTRSMAYLRSNLCESDEKVFQ